MPDEPDPMSAMRVPAIDLRACPRRNGGAKPRAPSAHVSTTPDDRLHGLSARERERLREARCALDHGYVAMADRTLSKIRPRARRHPEFLYLLGVTRHLQKRRDEAISALYGAAALRPTDAHILTSLGTALCNAGRIEAALACLSQGCRLASGTATAWYALGRALGRDARLDAAQQAFECALRCDPRHVRARIALGDALRTRGRIDRAVEQYRLALREPGGVRAWGRLANVQTVQFDARDAATLERLYTDPTLAEEDRVVAGFALAKALEDQGQYVAAFTVLESANALRRKRMTWNPAAFRRRNDEIARAFSSQPTTASPANLGEEVIFIVSLPRSGSTLTEQILASHPQVEGANELPDLWAVLDEESRRRGVEFPGWVPLMGADDWHRLGRRYLERTVRWRRSRPRFTDKALTNWRIIGAARAMLPGARFVNCRRDPLEVCLSCYRQRFARGQAFSYDLTELAAYWREHERMMQHWRQQHSGYIHDFVHEKLLAEPDLEIRRLLEFCRLRFDPACLRHHETRRMVRTISCAQVREPLRVNTAHAHLYGDLLAPLRDALARQAAEVGCDG